MIKDEIEREVRPLKNTIEILSDALSLYRRENKKLRELVKDIYTDMWNSGEWLEPYEQRMQELEIIV